jgi:hypothetical protein
MRIEEAARTDLSYAYNALVCEHCCRMLVAPKHRWVEYLQEYLHTFGEIVFILGNCFAMLYVGGVMLFAAVFSSHRNSHPYEEEYERYQKEWEDKKKADAERIEKQLSEEAEADAERIERRVHEEAAETAAYLNSLKVRFRYADDLGDDRFLVDQWNRKVEESRQNPEDGEKDRVTLRTYAVDIESLRLLEMEKQSRRDGLQSKIDYHKYEEQGWQQRLDCASDENEKRRCQREIDFHVGEVKHAKAAKKNV